MALSLNMVPEQLLTPTNVILLKVYLDHPDKTI
jgi:hypothetical protein